MFDQSRSHMLKDLDQQLHLGLLQPPRVVDAAWCGTIRIGNKDYIQFCTDDFLGYAGDSRLYQSVVTALERDGVGTAASGIAGGYRSCHARLEKRFARFVLEEDAVLFNSLREGYQHLFATIASDRDVVLLETGMPGEMQDAVKLGRAKILPFNHLDLGSLERAVRSVGSARRIIVVTESIVCRTGELTPLQEIFEIVEGVKGQLVVDESCAVGVLGDRGAGGIEGVKLLGRDVIVISSLSKTISCGGAVVASSKQLSALLRSATISFQSEATLAPPLAYAAESAFDLIESDSTLRSKLQTIAKRVTQSLRQMGYTILGGGTSPVIFVQFDEVARVSRVVAGLAERGLLVVSARSAFTPEVDSGIRLTVSAAHSDEQIAFLLQGFEEVGKRIGVI